MTEAFDGPGVIAPPSDGAARADAGPAIGEGRHRIALTASLTSRHAPRLFDELQALRGGPVVIDVSAVRQVGTLCLQVLASAHRTWAADGLEFRMSGNTGALSKEWRMFGLTISDPVDGTER